MPSAHLIRAAVPSIALTIERGGTMSFPQLSDFFYGADNTDPNVTCTYAVTAGTVPPGMTFFPSGAIIGSPANLGTYNFTVQVTKVEEDVDYGSSYTIGTASIDFTVTAENPLHVRTIIGDWTSGTPNNIYSPGHGLSTGENVWLVRLGGSFVGVHPVTVVDANNFTLDGTSSPVSPTEFGLTIYVMGDSVYSGSRLTYNLTSNDPSERNVTVGTVTTNLGAPVTLTSCEVEDLASGVIPSLIAGGNSINVPAFPVHLGVRAVLSTAYTATSVYRQLHLIRGERLARVNQSMIVPADAEMITDSKIISIVAGAFREHSAIDIGLLSPETRLFNAKEWTISVPTQSANANTSIQYGSTVGFQVIGSPPSTFTVRYTHPDHGSFDSTFTAIASSSARPPVKVIAESSGSPGTIHGDFYEESGVLGDTFYSWDVGTDTDSYYDGLGRFVVPHNRVIYVISEFNALVTVGEVNPGDPFDGAQLFLASLDIGMERLFYAGFGNTVFYDTNAGGASVLAETYIAVGVPTDIVSDGGAVYVAYIRVDGQTYNESTTNFVESIDLSDPTNTIRIYDLGPVTLASRTTFTAPSPALSTITLPAGTQGAAYSVDVSSDFGSPSPAATHSVTAGSLPAGVTLSSAGVISGTPTANGSFVFSITANNSEGSAVNTYSLEVSAASSTAPTIDATSNLGGPYASGDPISFDLDSLVVSGDTAISWSVISGSLPPGLSLVGSTISGSVLPFGTYSFTVRATNAHGTDDCTVTLIVESVGATIYWHNLTGNRDGNDRRNYTRDQAGTVPLAYFGTVSARYWRVQVDAVFATLASGVQEFYLYDGSGARVSATMTDNTTPAPQVASSNAPAPVEAFEAFDDNTATGIRVGTNQFVQIDMGVAVNVLRAGVRWETGVSRAGRNWRIQSSPDGVTWTDQIVVNTGSQDTNGQTNVFYVAGATTKVPVDVLDDLRFDGTGTATGNGDDWWNVYAGDTLNCHSYDGSGYSGTVTVDNTATINVTTTLYLGGGTSKSEWEGTLTVGVVTNVLANWGNSANRIQCTLTGNSFIRFPGTASSVTVYMDLTLTQPTLIRVDHLTTATTELLLDGKILGGQAITKTGIGVLNARLVDNGRTSNVGSVSIDTGTVFININAHPAFIVQGIGGTGGEPSACPITLNGNNTTLRYGSGNNGNSEWGNPLVVAPGINGAALLFQGTGNAAAHQCYFPVTLGSDLRLYRGTSVGSVVSFLGPVGWTGTGTVHADAGRITGAGRLTVERPDGIVANLDVRLDYPSGARAEHTGGTLITSPTQSNWASCGYSALTGTLTLAFGTNTIEVHGNARFWNAGADGDTRTITNAILLSGSFTGDFDIPWLNVGRITDNPTTIFSGMITVDCPAFRVDAAIGGNNQQHEFAGGVTLLQNTRLVFAGSNGQDLVFSSLITGEFSLSLMATTSGSDVTFSFVQTVARAYIVEAGSGYGIYLASLTALKTASSIEVLSGGRLWYETSGETQLDGQLLMRVGSLLGFGTPGRNLRLNGVGPHELSGSLVTPDNARSTEIRLPTDGTVIAFNTASPLSMPMFRMTGNVTFQTANVANTVIRPGQNTAATLPSGVSTMFLERGKTLTVNAPLQLSMNQSNGEATGASGVATINGTGTLSFVQGNGWAMPAYSNVVFDIDTLFAGTTVLLTQLIVTGQTFQKRVWAENNNVNLTVTFTDVTVGGDFYAYTNTAGGSGNMTIRWAGTCSVGGDYYQRHDADGPGDHRTEILDDCVMSVAGDWRPASNKVGGPGAGSSYTMSVYAGERWRLTVGGDWFTRIANTYNFEPLVPAAFNEMGKVIFDLTNNADGLDIDNEHYGTIADAEFINTSGAARSAAVSLGSWRFNSILVSGDDITLDMNAGGNEAYFGGLNCTGAACTLVLPDYLETYTFNWEYSGVSPDFTFDLRGFSSVDASNITLFGFYPDGIADYWFNGLDLTAGPCDFQFPIYDGPTINFRDDVTYYNAEIRTGNYDVNVYGLMTVVNSFGVISQSGATGNLWNVEGTLRIHGGLDLRLPTSTNPSYDCAIVTSGAGVVQFMPRSTPGVVTLDFDRNFLSIPDLEVILEDGYGPYDVRIQGYGSHRDLDSLTVTNQSFTQALTFTLTSETHINGDLFVEDAAATTLAFNNQILRLSGSAVFDPTVQISFGGVNARLRWDGTVSPSTHSFPTAQLPPLYIFGGDHLLGTALNANLLSISGSSVVDLDGQTIAAENAILEAPATLEGLAGTTWNIAQGWAALSVVLDASAVWYLNVGVVGAANQVSVSNSDASGGVEIEATASANLGGNSNWNFGLLGSEDTGADLGNQMGLGLTFTYA